VDIKGACVITIKVPTTDALLSTERQQMFLEIRTNKILCMNTRIIDHASSIHFVYIQNYRSVTKKCKSHKKITAAEQIAKLLQCFYFLGGLPD
jgi:hypothetical protein